jgi:hypothetical protein
MKVDLIKITLRKEGYGKAPTYFIKIYEDGNVFYEGKENIKIIGRKETFIGKDKFFELLEDFRDSNFYNLKNDYSITDAKNIPQTIIQILIPVEDGKILRKTVTYFQKDPSIPEELKEIEKKIHEIVGFNQWEKPRIPEPVEKPIIEEKPVIKPPEKEKKHIFPKIIEKPVSKPKKEKPIKLIVSVFAIVVLVVVFGYSLYSGVIKFPENNGNSNSGIPPDIVLIKTAGSINGLEDFVEKEFFKYGDTIFVYVEYENVTSGENSNECDLTIQISVSVNGSVFRNFKFNEYNLKNYSDSDFLTDEYWPEGRYTLNLTLIDNIAKSSTTSQTFFNLSKESLKIDVLEIASEVNGFNDYVPLIGEVKQGDTIYVYVEYSSFSIRNDDSCDLLLELSIIEINGDKTITKNITQTNSNKIVHYWPITIDDSWVSNLYAAVVTIKDNISNETITETGTFRVS